MDRLVSEGFDRVWIGWLGLLRSGGVSSGWYGQVGSGVLCNGEVRLVWRVVLR
nr:MAG TPA: hypothetical protein [Caudoviricetes sp.]